MTGGTLPARDAIRQAFELALEHHLASLPPGGDLLAEISAVSARLRQELETAACTSPDMVEEMNYRALMAAQLDVAVSNVKARHTRG